MDLYSMIQNGGHFKVEVTSEDLVTFADRLITKSQEIKAMELANNTDEEKWLTAEEAAKKAHAWYILIPYVSSRIYTIRVHIRQITAGHNIPYREHLLVATVL